MIRDQINGNAETEYIVSVTPISMNDYSNPRAQQLAELEAAPELPLPDAALREIEAWLPELCSQRAAQLAGPTDAKIAGANN